MRRTRLLRAATAVSEPPKVKSYFKIARVKSGDAGSTREEDPCGFTDDFFHFLHFVFAGFLERHGNQ
jgi:hypothetical protein